MYNYRAIFKNSYFISLISIGLGKIFTQTMPIFVVILFSKLLELDELGKLTTALAFITLITIISDFGISLTVTRYSKESNNDFSFLIYTRFFISLVFAIGITIVGSFYTNFTIAILLGLSSVLSMANTFIGYYVNNLKHKTVFFSQLISSFAFLVFSILFYYSDWEVSKLIISARLLSWLIIFIPLLIDLYLKNSLIFRYKPNIKLLTFSKDIYWFTLVESFISNVDVISITLLIGSEAAGVYKPAALIGLSPMLAGIIISAPLIPVLLTETKEKQKQLMQNILFGLTILMLIFGIFLSVISKLLLELIYTEDIAKDGYLVLISLVIASSLYVIAMPIHELLMVSEDNKFISQVSTLRIIFFSLGILLNTYYKDIHVLGLSFIVIYFIHFILYFYKYWKWMNQN